MKMRKKAFTTLELLMALAVSMTLLTLMFLLLMHTTNLYNKTVNKANPDGFALILVSDMEKLSRGCDFVELAEGGRILVVHDNDMQYSIDTRDYGIDAKMLIDNKTHSIYVYVGGDVYCIKYMQNEPY